MTTDEEKQKIAKILQCIEVPENKISERCTGLVKEFRQKFGKELEEEEHKEQIIEYPNPYIVDPQLLEETNKKLLELHKKVKKTASEHSEVVTPDPKKPWRMNSNKEKLLRIDNELKRHMEKAADMLVPLSEEAMKDLVKECQQQDDPQAVTGDQLRDTVDAAKKNLPNFQYKRIDNSTATSILQGAHDINSSNDQN